MKSPLEIKQNIAKKIYYYRKSAGLTQKQLAELLGVKNTAVSNWENGQNSIDTETLFKVCEIFKVTINDMYGIPKEEMSASNDTIVQDKLTPHEQAVLEAYRSQPEMQPAVDRLLGIQTEPKISADTTDEDTIAAVLRSSKSTAIK